MSHVVCFLNVEADRATFTWSEGPASFQPYTLDGLAYQDFKEAAATARAKLADLIKDYLYAPENEPRASFALAEAGYDVYQALFDPGAQQKRQAMQVRRWLEKLARQHEVDTLEIVFESPWMLPWNVIYDREPAEAEFLAEASDPDRWRPFWGLRYNLCGGRRVDPLRRMPVLSKPDVLLVVDRDIRDGLPADQQRRLDAFADEHGFKVVNTKDELKAATRAERPDILYWLSHAECGALILSHESVSPRDLRRLLKQDDDEDLGFGGLAFLNACQTAECSCEEGSFFEAFHSVGFAGMIGTEHQTIDQFANPLGLDFLEAFLDRGEPVGAVLRQLRARVPLGLLYGTYCPPNIHVAQGPEQDTVDIHQSWRVEGRALGGEPETDDTGIPPLPPLPPEPYRSLAHYEGEDRALFAGRDDDIERFATLFDDAGTRLLVLHGESGVGKSSFLRAGVIPFVEEECVGYRFLRGADDGDGQPAGAPSPVLFVRATNDLFGQLAQALCEFCCRPYEYRTPLGDVVSADLPGMLREFVGCEVTQATVRALLRSDVPFLGRILAAVSDSLPFSAILVIDQAEEIFTLAQTPEDQRRGRRALDMLRQTLYSSGDFKVILSMRTEYYGRFIDRLQRGLHDTLGVREYLLTDFDEKSLIEAILRPTSGEQIPYATVVPFEKYGFRYAEGLAEEIAHRVVGYTTQRRDSVLPLMQVICAQLYRIARRRDDATVTMEDLEALGGIEGGTRRHVEGLLDELLKRHPRDRKPLKILFSQLYLKQPDGTLTTALLPETEIRRRWTGRTDLGELIESAQSMRLLKIDTLRIGFDEERRYVSLGHDSLAKIAADWDDELGRLARVRRLVAAVAVVSVVALLMAALSVWALLAKSEARANLDLALDSIDNYYHRVSDETLLNQPGMQGLRKKLLADAVEDYRVILAERGGRASDPIVEHKLAETYYRAGRVARLVDSPRDAAELLTEALRIQLRRHDKNSDDLEHLQLLGKTWTELGTARYEMERAAETPDWESPKAAFQEAIALRRQIAVQGQQDAESHRLLANALLNLGNIEAELQDFNAAGRHLTEAQAIRETQLQRDDLSDEIRTGLIRDLARGNYNLARLHRDHFNALADQAEALEAENDQARAEITYDLADEKFADAERQIHDAIRRLKALETGESNLENEFLLAMSYRLLGELLSPFDDEVAAARTAFSEAERHMAALVRGNPSVTTYREELAAIRRLLDDL